MSEAKVEARPPVAVIGAGRFGQALARAAARTGDVLVWSRRAVEFDEPSVRVAEALEELAEAELVLFAVPSRHAASTLDSVGCHLDGGHLLVHVSRGLVDAELHTLSHLFRARTPSRRVGALAGPISAELLIEGTPGGGVVGSEFPEVVDAVRAAIAGPTLRIYASPDLRGVELAAAFTGLLLFTVGFARQVGFGPSTIGALTTRGVAEASRVAQALGARPETFAGLACFGDLFAAIGGADRPELVLGRAVARGHAPEVALEQAGGSIEGIEVARRVAAFAQLRELHAPLATAIAALVDGAITPDQAVRQLMGGGTGSE